MSHRRIHEGDIGTRIKVRIMDSASNEPVDLTGYTSLQVWLQPPRGEGKYHEALPVADGSDGWVYFQSATENDLSPAGDWRLQARVVLPNWSGHSEVANFHVYAVRGGIVDG